MQTLSYSFCALLCWMSLAISEASADTPKVRVEFRRAETRPAEGLIEAVVGGGKEKVYLYKDVSLTNKDISQARVDEDVLGRPAIQFFLTKDGAEKMAKLSEIHQDKPVAFLVDGKVLTAPILMGKLTDKV